MLQSMTAFMSHAFSHEGDAYSWDLRSVNHRYLDTSIKLPEAYAALESKVRSLLKEKLHRGKVECVLKVKVGENQKDNELHLNQSLLSGLLQASHQLQCDHPEQVEGRFRAMDLLRWPGMISQDEQVLVDDDVFLQALSAALEHFIAHRTQEGEALKAILLNKLSDLESALAEIIEAMPKLIAHQSQKLRDKLEELQQVQLDEGRLEQELVYLLQRLDIEEEIARLKTHVDKVRTTLATSQAGSVGKMLDFYMQELNREANTICSKSQSAGVTQSGVELKVIIEQMREQIQNIQ